jgi:hypothetical protein
MALSVLASLERCDISVSPAHVADIFVGTRFLVAFRLETARSAAREIDRADILEVRTARTASANGRGQALRLKRFDKFV